MKSGAQSFSFDTRNHESSDLLYSVLPAGSVDMGLVGFVWKCHSDKSIPPKQVAWTRGGGYTFTEFWDGENGVGGTNERDAGGGCFVTTFCTAVTPVENRGATGTIGVYFFFALDNVETCLSSVFVSASSVLRVLLVSDFFSTDTLRVEGLVGAQLDVVTGIDMDKAGGVAFMVKAEAGSYKDAVFHSREKRVSEKSQANKSTRFLTLLTTEIPLNKSVESIYGVRSS